MFTKITLLVSLAVSASICIAGADPSSGDRFARNPILAVTVDGQRVEVPRFRPGVELSAKRYAFDEGIIEAWKPVLLAMTRKVFINRAYSFSMISDIRNMVLTFRSVSAQNKALKKVDSSPQLKSGLGKTNAAMLNRILEAKNVPEIDGKEAQKRMETFFEALNKIVKISNTGLCLDFTKMTIGGENLESYMAPVVQKLTKGNFAMKTMCGLASSKLATSGDEVETDGDAINLKDEDDSDLFDSDEAIRSD